METTIVAQSATQRQRYELPETDTYDDWRMRVAEDFAPTQRQQLVMEAVQAALDAKLYYTSDVLAFCITHMGVTPEQAGKQSKTPVEGGWVGMDCYYARDALGHQATFAELRKVTEVLNPYVGQDLGTLIFNDFKRNTGMRVIAISENRRKLTLEGKRGRYKVTLECTPVQIKNAMDRAANKGSRKDTFEKVFTPAAGLFA